MTPHPIQPDQKTMLRLVSDDKQCEKYIDALMLIHDMLAQYAEEQEKPRFNPDAVRFHMEKILAEVLPDSVAENIRHNYALANDLKDELNGYDNPYEFGDKATTFLHELLQIYTTLKTLRHALEVK